MSDDPPSVPVNGAQHPAGSEPAGLERGSGAAPPSESAAPAPLGAPSTQRPELRGAQSGASAGGAEEAATEGAAPSAGRLPKLEHLLAASAATFAARGYAGTSMRDIAHDSGISLSGIYYYTRGKAALLYEIQSRTLDALLAAAADALADVTRPRDQLLRFLESHVAYTNDHPAFVRVLSHETAEGADERRQVVEAKRREYVRVLRDILDRIAAESPASVPPAFAADMLFAMMSGPRQWGITDTSLNVGSMSRAVFDLFLRGYAGGTA